MKEMPCCCGGNDEDKKENENRIGDQLPPPGWVPEPQRPQLPEEDPYFKIKHGPVIIGPDGQVQEDSGNEKPKDRPVVADERYIC